MLACYTFQTCRVLTEHVVDVREEPSLLAAGFLVSSSLLSCLTLLSLLGLDLNTCTHTERGQGFADKSSTGVGCARYSDRLVTSTRGV